MARSKGREREVPAPLARAAGQFETWRRGRTTHRIPEDLWTVAVEMANRYGLNPTARTLGVDYKSLKARRDREAGPRGPKDSGGFVELFPPPLAPSMGYVVEFEAPSGAKLKVHLPGEERPDLVALGRLFLERRA